MGQEQQINATNGTNGVAAFTPDKPNSALFTNEKREIFMGTSPELNPGPDECIVRMRCNGICGSDVHFWHTGRIGPLIVESDHCLGHEGAGTVVWAGAEVKHLKAGDNVAVEPGVPCNHCFQCSSGNYNLCAEVEFSGVPPHPGSIRRWHVHPSKFLHKLPEGFSFSDGALLEPLSVILHGFERSPIKLGESTVVCGAGPIGMCALAVAKASGAAPILMTDLDAGRLKFAKSFVPNCITYQINTAISAEETAKDILKTLEAAGGDQPRVVYECTGVQSSVVTSCYLPRAAGEVMVIGVGRPIMNDIPFMHISLAEVDLKFINRYHHSWPAAIRLLQHKVIDLQPLVTHRFKLEEADKALEASADRNSGSIKIHIEDLDD
ncbi:L-arabinitol 4-dehydrogenase [Fulvia fulva]|uniref:L-arabinitol 4-dehydrogenase n=1 Tax=Passalora fulva TaxID=5499 RepID=A0A9Q8LF64_PASFU|nr:L-arabinitol 4-dehydrogenase [Fulvia fulva]KAK4626960.1 L-arabinitol 4-dehydrogenase [Fulvia fulva]KAK4628684.1 L-arabinitol 4-dehydrogenase [Fulvia fulva]UJO16301.1 L-arabinitol 4-dehydrogenase [Fulvia fulva]WPV13782.1 L-arabinitol 4-dehydrogenase [Fulvia fulva]WPV28722.1 L-arabinitol 4-dehydrogenase [Fulvia fulva]